ncbi:hypothetical protein Ade02nite_22840 [Paractinoplanes deccanensis]|uniref:OmpR/PhoB-type domain-containing protein n=1 Tax=Paractinoplanes deccanensis TaxID=113561 RepID=A0ABQ3Y0W4_9ACTN|nr:BTAD domain-containing putative transcriptional regulator [Actinoplanes deccanensis]GID73643.1 hypothetical protein Ade02nite_22840 [Actinoplanes deccanensis]
MRALRDGTPVDLGPAKQRAVLAVLVLQAGRPVPTHHIVDAVWGDDPPENGANVVQKYVAGLRRVLDPARQPRTPGELLALTGSGYVLRIEGHALDADEFMAAVTAPEATAAALREALALWRGEALAGLTGPVFEAARVRLTEARATAWERWAELSQGREPGLIAELSRLIGEFPLREGLRAQLMIALHRSGRQAEALAAFREARAYLLDEFGIEPGELLQETHRRILRGDAFPVPAGPDAAEVAGSAPSGPPSAPPFAGPPFAGPPFAGPPPAGPSFAGPSFAGPPAAGPVVAWPHGFAPHGPVPPAVPDFLARPAAGRPRVPVLEVLFAAVLPVVTLSLGSWIYFVVAAARLHNRRLLIPAAVYALMVVAAVVFMELDPSPLDSAETSAAEGAGIILFGATVLLSAVHGAVIAALSARTTGEWLVREQSRLFATLDPRRARTLGIGRPDLARRFDDGGLIDINHVPAAALPHLTKLAPKTAERIAAARPFTHPADLLHGGLLSARTYRRLEPRLIALPPAPPEATSPT